VTERLKRPSGAKATAIAVATARSKMPTHDQSRPSRAQQPFLEEEYECKGYGEETHSQYRRRGAYEPGEAASVQGRPLAGKQYAHFGLRSNA
jgi:hypothetical protein